MTQVTVQATGYAPVTFEGVELAHAREMLEGDKRGVQLDLYRKSDGIVALLTYVTSWGDERPVSQLCTGNDLDEVAAWVRKQSWHILPPGAGFPATSSYETRQAKLEGLMTTLTLHALTEALKQIGESPPQMRQDGAG